MGKFPFWTVLLGFSLIFLYPLHLPGIPPLIPGMFTFHFSHAGLDHLFQNVVTLLIFGYALETKEGIGILQVSFISSLLGGLAAAVFGGGRGFSAGIFGIMGYLMVRYPGMDILGVPAAAFAFGYSLYSLLFQRPDISAVAHAIGFIAGMLQGRKMDWFAWVVAAMNLVSAGIWVVRFA